MSACTIAPSQEAPEIDSIPRGDIHAPIPYDPYAVEVARLRALYSLDILDTPAEPEFDDLVQLAAAICASPMCAISFIDDHRQWFKASVGIPMPEIPRELTLCNETILQRDLVIVEDASVDPRFSQHRMVVDGPRLRFYAGMPLTTAEGYAVGTFCMLGPVARGLTAEQQSALRVLSVQVNSRLELRNERRALENALREAQAMRARAEAMEQRFQIFMDSSPFIAFLKDAESRFVWYNKPLAAKLAVLQNWPFGDDSLPRRLQESYRKHDLEVLQSGQPLTFVEEAVEADGSLRNVRAYKFPFSDETGRVLVGGISVDITEDLRRQAELKRSQAELERANQRLQELASQDPLTHLFNRRAFDERLRVCFKEALESGAPLSVLMLDVDHFKSHNDRFGHAHGDEVLRTLAAHLQQQLRKADTIARYGGEEFVLLLPNTDQDGAERLAERILVSVREFPWPVAPVTISIGAGILTPTLPNAETLVANADQALYDAKCGGRNCFRSYSDMAGQP